MAAAAPRKLFVGGNFKAAATKAIVSSQVELLNAFGDLPNNVEILIAPSALHIGAVQATLRADVHVAAQDVHHVKALGAYTGSHAVDQLVDAGIKWTLTGHSERRSIFGETDEQTAAKTKAAVDAGLGAVLCVGETLSEREAGNTLPVVFRQLQAAVSVLPKEAWAKVVVAYEPVWAIGTGKVATPEQAQEVHAAVRAWLVTAVGADVAASLRIIYGGSVNGANAATLAGQADIDGFLVGGASLKPEFATIIRAAAGAVKAA